MEIVNPNVKNFIKSLRDIGYTFEVAVADVIDNSITAKSKNIKIHSTNESNLIFSIFDDGIGMNEKELIEAMRLSSKDPDEKRDSKDLGKFGLGLKTASFSQCRQLTVITKKNNIVSTRKWDLDFISQKNEWYLLTPKKEEIRDYYFYEELLKKDSGTIIIWEKIDRYSREEFEDILFSMREHLRLVFHVFIEKNDLKIFLNNGELEAFNPFNSSNLATQENPTEVIKCYGNDIKIKPYILPHHSKLTQLEYDKYETKEGYLKGQGFYLYRANRLLIYGTWWGLHKITDSHKLVRIKIDINNNQDEYWGIDVKKSQAKPASNIKLELKRIINNITPKSSRVYTKRGKKIEDKNTIKFWNLLPVKGSFRFSLNKDHPLLERLFENLDKERKSFFDLYLKGLEAYLPLESIQAQLQENPLKIKQETALSKEEIDDIIYKLKKSNLSKDVIEKFLKTEIFKNRRELIDE